MSKKRKNELGSIKAQILDGVAMEYPSIIGLSEEDTAACFNFPGVTPSEHYGLWLLCCLWRSTGNTAGTGGSNLTHNITTIKGSGELSDEDKGKYAMELAKEVFNTVGVKILVTKEKGQPEGILTTFLNKDKTKVIEYKENNSVTGGFSFIAQKQPNVILLISLINSVIHRATKDYILGYANSPIFIPLITGVSRVKTITLVGITPNHPSHGAFRHAIDSILLPETCADEQLDETSLKLTGSIIDNIKKGK